MSGAGRLRERFAFDERVKVEDGFGNHRATWAERVQVRAGLRALRGGESVMASRLEGKQVVLITIRKSSKTAGITTDWRARDARAGTVFNIREISLSRNRLYYEMLCESGVNAG